MEKVKGTALALGVVGLVLGGIIGYAVAESDDSDTIQTTASTENNVDDSANTKTPAADLRVELNSELREHVLLSMSALKSVYGQTSDTEAIVAELDKNSVAIADLLGEYYPDQRDEFLSQWREHIDLFVNYTVAARDGDDAAMQQAQEDLSDYASAVSTFLTDTVGLEFEQNTIENLFTEHRDLMIAAVNAYGAEDYSETHDQEAQAYNQAGTIADTLAEAIAKQEL